MSRQTKREPDFSEEAVSYGETTSGNEPIPVVGDDKYGAEGMDKVSEQQADSDAQLGTMYVEII
jgi:hypothetical protein